MTAAVFGSEYLHWAKTRKPGRFNLATSAVTNLSITDLDARIEDIEICGPGAYGYEPLQNALAKKCGVSSDCVVAATGTSLANYLAMAAVIKPGDEVLIEHPAYEPLPALCRYLGGVVKRFTRVFEEGFQISTQEIERRVSSRTRLIVITNLHNPSGAISDEAILRRVGEIARSIRARVLIDEVYLECLFERMRTAFHLGKDFVVTSSLTKAYGAGGLRCGWALAEPELAQRMWRIKDLLDPAGVHAAEQLSVIVLQQLNRIASRAKALLSTNGVLLDQFLKTRTDVEAVLPVSGSIVFPRLRTGGTAKLVELLRTRYETDVVPGTYFGMPDHFRLGIGVDTETLAAGLERLGAALDDYGRDN